MGDTNYINTFFSQNVVTQSDYLSVMINFVLCVVMSFILRSFYIKRSFSLTGKKHIGSIIPILSTVVFLVILVVKSSLALSLGLVGALSIVRFRTPIKEPEELVYLFLSIAIGLGYAAGQTLLTSLIFNCLALGAVNTEMLEQAFPGYDAPLSAAQMGEFIVDFYLNGRKYFNGQVLPVALTNP